MPEGPECRKYAEELAKRVSGRKIIGVDILGGRYKGKPLTGLDGVKVSLPLEAVGAGVHGKFIYWIFKDEWSLWNTLGLTGEWSSEKQKHSRVRIALSDGELYFNDMRNFGTLKFVRGKYKLIEKLHSLGPDMLAGDISHEAFIKRFRAHPGWQITTAMMNQGVVAGIGNYVKADSLWLARISPHRTVSSLSDDELSNLCNSVKQVMRENYNSDTTYGKRLLVYNQKTDPDGNEVVREMTADKRTTHWCPSVQK